ncbi:hypothetical protein [Aeropyrum camini]|uniref:Leucyl aminopeptidase n=1 Tax=Aeropyrum camini SY1 = JCM 12091 TaxID=1198449 RepID=U3T8B8_9CREN|nr:hypothetical protein [Aeropyrum camini]BAN89772.1 leucyl aminopeptidase [Aeropyrum camini SY1 = JCM 12091]
MIIREEWIEPYRRVVIVEEGGRRFYSIDFYMEWRDEAPRGLERVAGVGGKEVWRLPLDEGCEALFLITPASLEVISLRLSTSVDRDPASGDARAAAELCEEGFKRWLGSARS